MPKITKLGKNYSKLSLDVALRLYNLKVMVDHRNITVTEIAKYLECSKTTVYNVLAGTHADPLSWTDRIETAVTAITDARGGVPLACCGWDSLGHYRELIDQGTLHG